MQQKTNPAVRKLPLLSAVIYFIITGLVALATSNNASANELTPKQKQELIYLLKQDCGSCHGLTMQGGLGPALLKKNLKGKPLNYIEIVISEGRPGTPMPPWKEILTKAEIHFIAEYLLSDSNVLANYLPKTKHSSDDEKVNKKQKSANSKATSVTQKNKGS
ncbi:MAG: cytochrome c [Kangiellaceae bacterium]|nr:cytochrome c [Kangiellaceae bacterium]MCW8999048.1 cytochrome c [Kangiellaceae bacterium]MCW9016333.1 cytochrome c [Kangiellaceae bacterium]